MGIFHLLPVPLLNPAAQMELELRADSLAYGGAAVCRHQGKPVFVQGALPGELVQVSIEHDYGKHATARLLEVLEPSPQRCSPRCDSYAEGCGGCQWQHLEYTAQATWKETIVKDCLQRIGKLDLEPQAIVPAPNPEHYRNRLQLHHAPDQEAGFYRLGTREIVPLRHCIQAGEPAAAAWEALRHVDYPAAVDRILLRTTGEGDIGLYLYGHLTAPQFSACCTVIRERLPHIRAIGNGGPFRPSFSEGADFLEEQVGGHTFRVPLNAFFQNNLAQTENLLQLVAAQLQLEPNDRVLDLHCGVGLFALFLAKQVAQVTGIDTHRGAIAAARHNAQSAGLNNARFLARDALQGLRSCKKREYSCVILDPPRSGCAPALLSALAALEPQRLVYVSCAPDTLARDLARLDKLGYTCEQLVPLDMFPHTYHVETVAGLRQR